MISRCLRTPASRPTTVESALARRSSPVMCGPPAEPDTVAGQQPGAHIQVREVVRLDPAGQCGVRPEGERVDVELEIAGAVDVQFPDVEADAVDIAGIGRLP